MLELANHGVEGIANGDVEIFVRMVCRVLSVDDELVAGHVDMDAHAIQFAFFMMIMRRFHHHVASGDVLVESVEPAGSFANFCLDGVGVRDSSKRDLQFCAHIRTKKTTVRAQTQGTNDN